MKEPWHDVKEIDDALQARYARERRAGAREVLDEAIEEFRRVAAACESTLAKAAWNGARQRLEGIRYRVTQEASKG